MSKLVFIVDDDPGYRQYIQTYLSHFGYEVKGFADGADCLASLEQNPEFVVLDHFLANGETGLEVLRGIKRVNPKIPVIYLSAQKDISKAVQALKLGSVEYIEKNTGALVQLKAAIDQLANRKKGGFLDWLPGMKG
ncbi:MAG: response regulator [Cyclobacteriaceae bacterium]|nr:response regulator [Cyclobacteriaceae bacterium]